MDRPSRAIQHITLSPINGVFNARALGVLSGAIS